MTPFFLQISQTTSDTATAVADAAADGELTPIGLLIKGGWMVVPILLLGFLGLYVYIERFITIRKASKIDDNFMRQIKDMVQAENLKGAISIARNSNTPVARMLEKGLSRMGKPLSDIRTAIENEGNLEVLRLEKNMALLATVAGGAPMLGFLGTVTGMISAFHDLSQAGTATGAGVVAGGIYEALVTTAVGLFVGIPAYLMYNHLTSMIDKLIFRMEATTVEFVDLLEEPVSL